MNVLSLFSDNTLVYRESDALTNIDGFLVTDGHTVRVTIRSRLATRDKQRGKQELISRFRTNQKPGVYLWNSHDGVRYDGANSSHWTEIT